MDLVGQDQRLLYSSVSDPPLFSLYALGQRLEEDNRALTDMNRRLSQYGENVTELYTGVTNAASYEKDYTPGIKTYQAYWLDISEQKDFVFDGNLLEFELKVNENTPDGIYPIEVYFADLSNYSANTDENADKLNNVKFRPGYVCVNKAKPEIPALGKEMTLTPDTVSAKPGESVRVNVRVDNNPGLVAFVIRMHFDNNAMSISKGGAGSDLGDVALLTARTLD